ncbi:hypothetical protein JCGZ_22129 [Jatropha curcas]|uniref:Uncharacterized protein n=1 Tax=Jatropha curcas TaxID=180498 RepID=A0A067LIB4_JATCU|nr:uncharacterized protein LOC105629321 [Jatropha curcas]KDP47133.1 hypothetical protein JCGZ_22129 [Jatropha curcas]
MGKDHDLVLEAIDYDQEEEEGDAFYNELRRQILVLTEDDDDNDEDFLENKHGTSKSDSRQISLKRSINFETQLLGSCYSSCWESDGGSSVPPWLVNLWRNGNGGTGVFIPHIVKSRRRHKSGKKNNGKRKINKQVDDKYST